MAADAKTRMIEGALAMLATQGLQGASFADILKASGAPRGSVYHHFPGGKNQLVAAAIEVARTRALEYVEQAAGGSALDITKRFIDMWRKLLTRSELRAGCSVLAVAIAAETPELRAVAGTIFRDWRARLARLLAKGGLGKKDATRFAATLIAATEGAVALSRAEQSLEPLELTASMLVDQVTRLMRPA